MKKQSIKFEYDKEAGALYIKVGKGKVVKTEPISSCSLVDYDKNGKIIGIEMINAKKDTKSHEITLDLKNLQKITL